MLRRISQLQKLENERQELLLHASIEGQERERKRLAKDLHDGIGSLLSGLSLNLKFQRDNPIDHDQQLTFLNQACDLIEEGISTIRSISYNLMPVTLERFGIVRAIEEHVSSVKGAIELNIDFIYNKENLRFSPDVELALLRIFQELLQNTIKHAQATRVKIALSVLANKVVFSYMDNGIGLPEKLKEEHFGIGLKGIESRARLVNGELSFTANQDWGLVVNLHVSSKTLTHE